MGPSTLEVNVVTYTGSKKVYVDPVWTFEQLKLELHEHLASLRIPPPLSQKLVRTEAR